MVTIIEYILFLLMMITLLFINKKLRKSVFTVSNYLIVTFSVMTLLQVIACYLFDYKKPTIEYWIILTIFIFVAVLTDLGSNRFASRVSLCGVKIKKGDSIETWADKNEKKFDIICIVAALYAIFLFVKLARGFPNLYYVVQDEFQNEYTRGINYYIRLLMLIATPYYWGCSKLSKKNIFMGLICLIPNILTFVKGIVFIPCLASILLRLKKGDITLSLKAGIAIVLVGISVFFIVYLSEMGIYNPDILFEVDTYKFIGSKLINYLIAGVQSFSQNISENNIDVFRSTDNITLAPFINIIAKLNLEKSITPLCTIWQTFGFSSLRGVAVRSNVNTYIGTLYLYNGFLVGLLLNVFWVFIASFFDEIASEKLNLVTALSSLFCAGFALGWFEFYFMQPFWIYLIVITALIELLFRFKLTIKK